MFKLVIGNKNFSSWSLRPWLVLKMLNEPFEERMILLQQPDTTERILAINPAGRVPVLYDRNLKVWDSLAICEYLAECFPHSGLLPVNSAERAVARSLVAEMHAGFQTLRQVLPMDIARRHPTPPMNAELQRDIDRIAAIWQEQRLHFGAHGPFLFGHFTIVDAFFAPVVTRFSTYQIQLPEEAQRYSDHILSLPAMQEWAESAATELQAR
jgi:glutathione S-transferase